MKQQMMQRKMQHMLMIMMMIEKADSKHVESSTKQGMDVRCGGDADRRGNYNRGQFYMITSNTGSAGAVQVAHGLDDCEVLACLLRQSH